MTEDKRDPNDPSTVSEAWEHMAPKWAMIEHLLGGTEAMRAAGSMYLPQHAEESDQDYRERLETATLFNMTELTLNSLVGRPFSDPVKLKDDVPESIRKLEKDIDLQGNSISTFAREWFREGVAKALSHVLIEHPRTKMLDADGKPIKRTRRDDLRDNNRPYWVHIKPENVIFMQTEVVGGVERLTHVRIYECFYERVGFAQQEVKQIRVLEPGTFTVYRAVEDKRRKKKVRWDIVDGGETGLDFVPMVTFYAERKGVGEGKPPMEDLAYLNVRHWQSTADQNNILTVIRFPMLAVAGATDQTGDIMKIGPRQLLGTRQENGRFYYVEHSGKAVEAGERDLAALEEQMASYGAEFLKKRPGNPSATARALDSAEATSPLQDMTNRFIGAMNAALDVTAAWLGEKDGGTVDIPTDFGPDEISDVDMRTLSEARRNRDLSRKAYLLELKRRGALSDDFNPEADLKLLTSETVVESPFATGQNVGKKPGAKGAPPDSQQAQDARQQVRDGGTAVKGK